MDRQDELAGLIDRHAAADGINPTGIPRLYLIRASRPTEPLHAFYSPELCIFVQGKKEVFLGGQVYPCDRDHHLLVSVDLPVVGQVVEAAPEEPYLALQLDLDMALLNEMLSEEEPDAADGRAPGRQPRPGLALSPNPPELLDAAVRLVRLLDTPRDVTALAPLFEREILYRLLTGEQGRTLRQISLLDGRLGQVGRAIAWIKEHYREPFGVEDVASEARMSTSALYHHFKTVTSMSPVQYRTRLRLEEARRLILGTSVGAASAGFRVGYGNPSHFSREYSRFFGAPPRRDAQRLKASRAQETTVR